MTKQQDNVKTFMQTFGQETPEKPTTSSYDTRLLRVKLLLEEVLELAAASGVKVISEHGELIDGCSDLLFAEQGDVSLVDIADALADIDYVNQGAAVAFGLDLEQFSDEVHSSNMTKLWKEEEIGEAKKSGYNISPVGDKYLVKRSDGKVIKSPSYQPANLSVILKAQD